MTSTATTPEWRPRAEALAENLQRNGAIRDPAWREMFAQVPRHAFVPCWWAIDEHNRIDRPLRADDPDHDTEWLDGIYADRALVTQWADGGSAGRSVRIATSSASQPRVVATMLDRLRLADGHRVLEIGTGTGYHAALLCERLGDRHVSSIDIHPDLVATARERLAACGHRPHLYVGDGASPPGVEGGYDRIIATCAVSRIPDAWLDRLAPGGRIVTPLTFGAGLVALDRDDDGTVSGPVDGYQVNFMPLRAGVGDALTATTPVCPRPDPARSHYGVTHLNPARLDDTDFAFWLLLHDPELFVGATRPGTGPVSKLVHTSAAYAAVTPARDGEWTVRQQGGRPWDTVEAAWRSFDREGRPARTRITLTARPDGRQFFSLVGDEGRNTWPLTDTTST